MGEPFNNTNPSSKGWIWREDLELHMEADQASAFVFDPIRQTYFHLGPLEIAIANACDGTASFEQIARNLQPQLELLGETIQRLMEAFLKLRHAQLLIQPNEDSLEHKSKAAWSPFRLLSVTLWKSRSTAWFETLCDQLTGIVHSAVLIGLCTVMFWAMLTVSFQGEEIKQVFLQLRNTLSPQLSFQIVCGLILFKAIHELAHGVVARSHGVRVQEIGLSLLVFAPCAYCDISDSWRLTPFKRFQIAIAGILSDLFFASLLLLWGLSNPHPVQHTLGIVLGTLLFAGTIALNGNPLLKFDGYYALSDLVGIRNLQSRSMAVVNATIFAPQHLITLSSKQFGLLLYGCSSLIYRLMILGMICWMVTNWFEGLNMQALFLFCTGIWIVSSVLWNSSSTQQNSAQSLFRRFHPLSLLSLILLIIGLLVPFSTWDYHTGELTFRDPILIHAPHSGQIQHAINDNMIVSQGETLVTLHSLDWNIRKLNSEMETELSRQRLTAAQSLRLHSQQTSVNLDAHQQHLRNAKEISQTVAETLDQLTIQAPQAGLFHFSTSDSPTSDSTEHSESLADRHDPWTAHTYIKRLQPGQWVERGEMLGHLVNPRSMKAIIKVPAEKLADFPIGSEHRLTCSQTKKLLTGTVISQNKSSSSDQSALQTEERFEVLLAVEMPVDGIEGISCLIAKREESRSMLSRLLGWATQAWTQELAY